MRHCCNLGLDRSSADQTSLIAKLLVVGASLHFGGVKNERWITAEIVGIYVSLLFRSRDGASGFFEICGSFHKIIVPILYLKG
jgi:hypothetical protein